MRRERKRKVESEVSKAIECNGEKDRQKSDVNREKDQASKIVPSFGKKQKLNKTDNKLTNNIEHRDSLTLDETTQDRVCSKTDVSSKFEDKDTDSRKDKPITETERLETEISKTQNSLQDKQDTNTDNIQSLHAEIETQHEQCKDGEDDISYSPIPNEELPLKTESNHQTRDKPSDIENEEQNEKVESKDVTNTEADIKKAYRDAWVTVVAQGITQDVLTVATSVNPDSTEISINTRECKTTDNTEHSMNVPEILDSTEISINTTDCKTSENTGHSTNVPEIADSSEICISKTECIRSESTEKFINTSEVSDCNILSENGIDTKEEQAKTITASEEHTKISFLLQKTSSQNSVSDVNCYEQTQAFLIENGTKSEGEGTEVLLFPSQENDSSGAKNSNHVTCSSKNTEVVESLQRKLEKTDETEENNKDEHSKLEMTNNILTDSPLTKPEVQNSPGTMAKSSTTDMAVPDVQHDEQLHDQDLVLKAEENIKQSADEEISDSQLFEIDWDLSLPVRVERKPVQQDGTTILKGLVKELSNLNSMILRTKREIETKRRQMKQGQGQMTSRQNPQQSRSFMWNSNAPFMQNRQ